MFAPLSLHFRARCGIAIRCSFLSRFPLCEKLHAARKWPFGDKDLPKLVPNSRLKSPDYIACSWEKIYFSLSLSLSLSVLQPHCPKNAALGKFLFSSLFLLNLLRNRPANGKRIKSSLSLSFFARPNDQSFSLFPFCNIICWETKKCLCWLNGTVANWYWISY